MRLLLFRNNTSAAGIGYRSEGKASKLRAALCHERTVSFHGAFMRLGTPSSEVAEPPCAPRALCWSLTAPWSLPGPSRSTHDLVAMDGWLYAVGGNDGSSSLNSIEKYNPRTNKWVAASCMFTRRSSVGVAVLELLNFPPPSSPTLSVSSTSL